MTHNGKLIYYMTIYGNEKEKIHFKLLTEDTSYAIDQTINILNGSFKGRSDSTYPLTVTPKETVASFNILSIDKNPICESGKIYIKPKLSGNYELNLYNASGILVAPLFSGVLKANDRKEIILDNDHITYFSGLADGMYMCTLKGADTLQHIKLAVQHR